MFCWRWPGVEYSGLILRIIRIKHGIGHIDCPGRLLWLGGCRTAGADCGMCIRKCITWSLVAPVNIGRNRILLGPAFLVNVIDDDHAAEQDGDEQRDFI